MKYRPKAEHSVLTVILRLVVSGVHCQGTNEGRLITLTVSVTKMPSRGQIFRFNAELGVLVESKRNCENLNPAPTVLRLFFRVFRLCTVA